MVRMTNSILLTIKKMLGIAEEYHAFDIDIVTDINATFLALNQLGVGPSTPFQIFGDDENWSDFIDTEKYPGIQTYIYMRVRMMFDPPTNSFLLTSMENQCSEFEWRLMSQSELNNTTSPEPSPIVSPPTESEEEAIRRVLGQEVYTRSVVRKNQNGRNELHGA